MKKSILLEKILKKAKDISEQIEKTKVDSDCFVLAALSFCIDDVHIEGVNETEIANLKKLIKERIADSEAAYKSLLERVQKSPKGFSNSDVVFGKVQMALDAKSQKNGGAEITADLFLSAIFTEPTENLQAILNMGTNNKNDSAEKKSETNQDTTNKYIFGGSFGQKPTAPDPEPTEEAKPAKSEEPNSLAKYDIVSLIKKVKNAQNELLEIVHGQDHAINCLISGYYQAEITSLTEKDRTRPKATFLFAGPPGVGKTFLAEQAARVFDMPFRRFDMSEYSDNTSNVEFCGSDPVYKSAKEGNVTGFVAKNPKSILLFDEIEKAHMNVIHLFLQILDAGRIRDNFTDKEVSFANTILIFTTNVGRKLYEDSDIQNLSSIPRKQILNSLTLDINPLTNEPLFPKAICSRFSAGNVIMFNRLGAHNLLKIAKKEIERLIESFKERTDISVEFDNKVLYALMFAEGGNVDARAISGRASSFFCQETYELFRLATSDKRKIDMDKLKKIKLDINMPQDEKTRSLFEDPLMHNVLIFASEAVCKQCKDSIKGLTVFCAHDIEKAKEIMFKNSISLILCDVKYGMKKKSNVLNIEDADSLGVQFFDYIVNSRHIPIYLLEKVAGTITQEEVLSFMRNGAQGSIAMHGHKFSQTVEEKCNNARQQNKLLELARANKILSYKTSQKISSTGDTATITLFDFKLDVAPDVQDSKNLLSAVSKPTTRFDDVIGAEDAKDELAYFVKYLKDPISFVRRGVRAPKGILLYGPPGTGKTLLAKAMAGESDVTFIAAEGNAFMKRYVGEGPEKVHELFRMARKYAPSILFIDEIDTIGKNRSDSSGSESVASGVLTAFLTEMDGFKAESDKPVFVLAATNYDVDPNNGKSLDPALLRRFDRRILVDLPNKPERERFLRYKISKYPNVNLSDEQIANIALRSINMSLADLESVFELALRNSIKTENYIVDDACFENAFESFNSGEAKKWNISELKRTAQHEAGHALLCWLSGETPTYLTIVARGSHGGYMQHNVDETKGTYTKKELLTIIRTALAGRAAEVVYYGDDDGASTGASADLQHASSIAQEMVCLYGMDDQFGLCTADMRYIDSDFYSKIRERINVILAIEFESAKNTIESNIEAIDDLVEALLEKNHLKENEINEILSRHKK